MLEPVEKYQERVFPWFKDKAISEIFRHLVHHGNVELVDGDLIYTEIGDWDTGEKVSVKIKWEVTPI